MHPLEVSTILCIIWVLPSSNLQTSQVRTFQNHGIGFKNYDIKNEDMQNKTHDIFHVIFLFYLIPEHLDYVFHVSYILWGSEAYFFQMETSMSA